MRAAHGRTRLLRNPALARYGAELVDHIESWIKSSSPEEMTGLLDPVSVSLLRDAFSRIGGHEGTVWLADQEERHLVAVYNSGQDAPSLVGFEQPIGSGIVSMVYSQQQPYCENDIGSSAGHDDTLDRQVSKHTTAMIAVPFYFAFGLRGVVSCVQLAEEVEKSHGFSSGNVEELARVVNVVERLVNESIFCSALGTSDAG